MDSKEENLGCLLNGHKPRDFGVYYDRPNRRYGSICSGCLQAIWMPAENTIGKANVPFKDLEWKTKI